MTTIQYNQDPASTGDPIQNLQIDNSQATQNEIHIVDTLFTKNAGIMDKLAVEATDCIIIGVIFIVFSLPQTNNLIKKILPVSANSPYILIGIKTLAVMISYWLIKHFYLSRREIII
uniref:Uncharacterized protein n=1 Tax=viral metagenome TaxID=1070528 RepID=A0A6C0LV51_9ZZZZ